MPNIAGIFRTVDLYISVNTTGGLHSVPFPFNGHPVSPFPYAEMAATESPNNDFVFHLYHQIDESTVADDGYDFNTARWSSYNISIPTV